MTETPTFIMEFEFKEDLIDSVSNNPDIKFDNKKLEKEVESKPFGTLLEVEKKIGSDTTILSVKEVNEKLLKNAFVQ